MDGSIMIPIISDEELKRRYSKIRPIINHKFLVKDYSIPNLRTLRKWESTYLVPQFLYNYHKIDEIECLYEGIYPYAEHPTHAEILAQIPDDLVELADYFEVLPIGEELDGKYNHTWNVRKVENRNQYTVCNVVLYKRFW